MQAMIAAGGDPLMKGIGGLTILATSLGAKDCVFRIWDAIGLRSLTKQQLMLRNVYRDDFGATVIDNGMTLHDRARNPPYNRMCLFFAEGSMGLTFNSARYLAAIDTELASEFTSKLPRRDFIECARGRIAAKLL
ncbi:hypothetical protein [Bradyrhizobium sp. RDT46]|uniref:hypothetical protein n=1 Tax=Bradyrhizobium sp. RDT46 TaxID=3341829 RepID=UPI0035C6F5EF